MNRLFALVAFSLVAPAMAAVAVAQVDPSPDETAAEATRPTEEDGEKRTLLRQIPVEQAHAPFTRETVTKLNAIVRRSLDAVNEDDEDLETMRAAVDAAAAEDATDEARAQASEAVQTLMALKERSAGALADMDAAVAELKASDEKFNENILEGMIIFVRRVEKEIRLEYEKQAARIA
ncbi:MAG: hypothetical protein ACFB00_07890 [Parvularculaceae bacterium]